MRISHAWLEELIGTPLPEAEVADRLTRAGLEVEAVERFGEQLDRVVIATVISSRPHPERERLKLVLVDDGQGQREIVCGAPNVPDAGERVALAQLGAKLPNGIEITERKLGGVISSGMLCGETELAVGPDDSGLLLLGRDAALAPGASLADALALRDTVYTLGLTPNRPDCLGHVGVAREVCALFGLPFRWPQAPAGIRVAALGGAKLEPQYAQTSLSLGESPLGASVQIAGARVEIEDPERCPRYGAALVSGVTIGPSPFAFRYRLHVLGLRPISNVVDATNLVLLLFGHPIHAFDLGALRGAQIRVRRAQDNERMRTLDGVERALCHDDLLICDGEGPVALAGVMGGEGSQITERTRDVLIECAYFEPRGVRRTSKRTGLHTDSSHRFERGVDRSGVPRVLGYAAALIAKLGGGTALATGLDCVAQEHAAPSIALRRTRIARLLGAPFADAEVERSLAALGCTVDPHSEGFVVTAPGHRPDLSREVDLIEELARLHGYDALPTELPAVPASEKGEDPQVALLRKLREAAAATGLREAINYAFVAPRDLELAHAEPSTVRIVNPMTEDRSVMRTALLPGLLQNLKLAQSTQQRTFALFELGRVFGSSRDGLLPDERFELALLLWGERVLWFQEHERFDFYDAKGAAVALVTQLAGVAPETVVDAALAQARELHPKRCARLVLGAQAIGVVGELHPALVEAHGLEGRPVYARIEVGALRTALDLLGAPRVEPLPRFPSATRDLAVVVPEAQPALEVAKVLREAASALCERVSLFDIYRGEPIAPGHKSLAFHVVYRDPGATLTDRAVDDAHARVMRAAEERFSAQVRR